jgi:ribosomal protein L40E
MVMFNCSWCGAEVPPGYEFCPNCGQTYTATQTCNRCGAQVPINIRLCSQCGAFQEVAALDANAAGLAAPAAAPGVPGLGVPGPLPAGGPAGARAPQQKALWMKGPSVDPIYYASLGLAAFAGAMYWIPKLNIGLAVIALVVTGLGGFKVYKGSDRAGSFLLIIAVVIAVVAIIFSVKWTMRVNQITPALQYLRYIC